MPIAIKYTNHFNTGGTQLAAGVRAGPGTVGYLGSESNLTALSPGQSLASTSLAGNASWDGNVLRITASGFTMSGFKLNSGLYTTTAGTLTVENCIIDRSGLADSIYGIYAVNGPVTVRDTTVRDTSPNSNGACSIKSDASQVQIYRCDLSGFEDGWQCTSAGSIIDQVYVHHLDDQGVDPHNDCGQDFAGGTGTTTLTNSYLSCSGLSGEPAAGQSSCWTLRGPGAVCRNNYMEHGAYFLRLEDGTNYVVEDNDFGPVIPPQFGEVTNDADSMTIASWSNNRDSDNNLIPAP